MGFRKAGNMIRGYAQLTTGMSKNEVIKLLGEPSGRKNRNGVETLVWRNSEFKGWMRGGTIERVIECDFEDGKLTGWDGQNMSQSRW